MGQQRVWTTLHLITLAHCCRHHAVRNCTAVISHQSSQRERTDKMAPCYDAWLSFSFCAFDRRKSVDLRWKTHNMMIMGFRVSTQHILTFGLLKFKSWWRNSEQPITYSQTALARKFRIYLFLEPEELKCWSSWVNIWKTNLMFTTFPNAYST